MPWTVCRCKKTNCFTNNQCICVRESIACRESCLCRDKGRKQCIDPAVASTSTAVSTCTDEFRLLTVKTGAIKKTSTAVSTCTNEFRPLTAKTGAIKKTSTAVSTSTQTLNENEMEMVNALQKRLQETEKKAEKWEIFADKMETENRKLHNVIHELKGNIKVFCRVRPLTQKENEQEKAEKTVH
ncbi:kinesin-like protein KIN-14C isoform X1 [Temnothorax curvispinosus]|uniref:Kinesin-like protein KIN-14C isoform X1 n=1 Tax=Temnothorax curvispinosus TaxID=300111 RepID=A0A6J1PF53_9HYME|nr:kinesin-like protein KIN-14C isoform X1 [Temnothorax curvispinosus]